MSAESILSDWKRKATHPVYWLEGEEAYEIDKLSDLAADILLSPEEMSFNFTCFYGKDAKVEDIVNACRRYPMFAEKQVVVVKEAQQLKEIERLEPYISNPLLSTILIVAFKEKKLDGRGKLAKILKTKAHVLTTKKLYDNELPDWTSQLVISKGLEINGKALRMLVDHIGNDLKRIENEVDKITVNLSGKKQISEDDVEKYVGVSKEFNIFELQAAIASKDLPKSLQILNYFSANPKVGPIQLILPVLYSFFSKVYIAYGSTSRDEYSIASALGIKPFMARQYISTMQNYSFSDIQKILLMMNHANLKSLGVGRAHTDDESIMKEFVMKIMNPY